MHPLGDIKWFKIRLIEIDSCDSAKLYSNWRVVQFAAESVKSKSRLNSKWETSSVVILIIDLFPIDISDFKHIASSGYSLNGIDACSVINNDYCISRRYR